MEIIVGSYTLTGLSKINVLLGKNGCGKSTLLKEVESGLSSGNYTRYITPERGGALVYEAGVEQQAVTNPAWMPSTRRVNQYPQFRQQTMSQYRMLETSTLRALEASLGAGNDTHPAAFQTILDKINSLLDNIEIRRDDESPIFKIYNKQTGDALEAGSISSGESELISLAIECLAFTLGVKREGKNVLFLDEPDVHLHPDLQTRLIRFLVDLVEEHKFEVILATHSTAILGELSEYDDSAVALMVPAQRELNFESIDDQYKKILPVFGAHPLSNVFNQAPVLLVEGEDDERIWQQAVRSSLGKIKVYPIVCGSVNEIGQYEIRVKQIVKSVYDNAKAYSLRDRDESEESIEDDPPIIRLKLSCRTAENLLLADEVLEFCGLTWGEAKAGIDRWLQNNNGHQKHGELSRFKNDGFNRKEAKLKEVRMLIVGDILSSNKPWEVLVGQTIAAQTYVSNPPAHSIQAYLGDKVTRHLLPR